MDAFWSYLLDNQQAILAYDAKPDNMDELQRILKHVDQRFGFHVGHHDSGVDLILDANGHLEALGGLQAAVESAPELPCRVVVHWDARVLFGQRDPARYPADENGDILFRFACEGDILCVPRVVDFAVVFPSEDAAQRFARLHTTEDAEVKVGPYQGAPGFSWQVEVSTSMAPMHSAITAFEKSLAETAAPFGGRNDGWGMFRVSAVPAS